MTPTLEEAERRFLRALAHERHLDQTVAGSRTARNAHHETTESARALLAVESEKTPPPRKVIGCTCDAKVDWECPSHFPDCKPRYEGEASAPATRSVEDWLGEAERFRTLTTWELEHALAEARRLYREEKARWEKK